MSQLSKADLHIHTVHSDGAATVPELLEYVAARTDLRLIAVTDHDSITGACQAARLAREFGVEVVMGEEVSTADGHLLALFVDTFLPPGRPAAETIAAIHAQGGWRSRRTRSTAVCHRWAATAWTDPAGTSTGWRASMLA
jgi:predicted metal-dependent phosphoesterase TrpH